MFNNSGWFGKARVGVTLFVLVSAFILTAFWHTILIPIKTGEQGVYWSRFFGGTSDAILREGTRLKFPWDEIYIYDTRMQYVAENTILLTRDGMELNVDWSARYYPMRDTLPELHRTIGPDFARKIVVPQIVGALREIIGNNTAEQVYTGDEDVLLKDIRSFAHKHLDPYKIMLDNFVILRLDLPKPMQNSIIEKQINEQTMLAYRFRLLAEEEERKRKEVEARGIRAFEEISKIPILQWKGIEATKELAKSQNAKIIIMGSGQNSLPILLNGDAK